MNSRLLGNQVIVAGIAILAISAASSASADGKCGDTMYSMIMDNEVRCVPYGPGTPSASGLDDRSGSTISFPGGPSSDGDGCDDCNMSAQ